MWCVDNNNNNNNIKDRRKVFFGQQFDCSLRTDCSTKFGCSWTLMCSNQVLTACGLYCLLIIFNGSWGCPLIADERKTVAYSTIWKPRSALFRMRAFLYAEILFPHAGKQLRMRRSCFRMRRARSACGDRVSACWETTPHAGKQLSMRKNNSTCGEHVPRVKSYPPGVLRLDISSAQV